MFGKVFLVICGVALLASGILGAISTPPTCAGVDCPEGSVCELRPIQCVTVPCPTTLVPVCARSRTTGRMGWLTCANVRCSVGSCVMTKQCEPRTGACSMKPMCKE